MDGAQDLFPDSWRADALRADLAPLLRPVFFAIYPTDEDLPRVAEWQKRLCGGLSPAVPPRPEKLLHMSVAACGKIGRRTQPLPDAFHEAVRHFRFPQFDIVFKATHRFGGKGRAFVAVADETTQRCIDRLRIALADAQRWAGLVAARSSHTPHLTLGYRDGLPAERQPIPPFGFRASAVELVASDVGKSEHIPLAHWPLQ